MAPLEERKVSGYERVLRITDPDCGLRAFLAIHDTTLGPALGGTRLWTYPSEDAALADALELARAMTYKAALAELPCGGGKAVILLGPELKRTEAFEAYGRVVESLDGRFFTGPDVGITDGDLAAMNRATRHVASAPGLVHDDISEHTAVGVWHGLRACLDFAGIKRARVALQGVGSVGMALGRILKREGMELLATDTDEQRAQQAEQEMGARLLPPDELLTCECDVLAPCALGGVISLEVIPRLQARIICGCANNILASEEAGDELLGRGILYAPDYLVNAGGLIRGAEFHLLNRQDCRPSLERIYDRMRRVLELSQQRKVATARIAHELVLERLEEAKDR